MGTSLHLRELCGLWSFFGNVNVEQIPPGDLFCVQGESRYCYWSLIRM